jgi:hypothetical protein
MPGKVETGFPSGIATNNRSFPGASSLLQARPMGARTLIVIPPITGPASA